MHAAGECSSDDDVSAHARRNEQDRFRPKCRNCLRNRALLALENHVLSGSLSSSQGTSVHQPAEKCVNHRPGSDPRYPGVRPCVRAGLTHFGTATAHPTRADKISGNFEKIAAKADHFCKLVS